METIRLLHFRSQLLFQMNICFKLIEHSVKKAPFPEIQICNIQYNKGWIVHLPDHGQIRPLTLNLLQKNINEIHVCVMAL